MNGSEGDTDRRMVRLQGRVKRDNTDWETDRSETKDLREMREMLKVTKAMYVRAE